MSFSSLPPPLAAYSVFLALVFGLVFGSFGNAWAWRIVHHERISRGRSHCPVCGHTLGVRDLVPLASWLLLGGKCRYCGAPIPRRYPLSELLCAAVFLSALLRWGLTWSLLRFLLLGFLLMVASLVDCDSMELPDGLLLAGAAASLLRLLEDPGAWKSMVAGALLVPAALLLLVLVMDRLLGRESMGGGDIKLLAVLGLHLGPPALGLALLAACLLGLLFALLRRQERSQPFPFGPMLALGGWLTMLFGSGLLQWYLALL